MEALKFPAPELKDGDGGETEDTLTSMISIEVAKNGFMVRVMLEDGEELLSVYPYSGKGDSGPEGMINDLIVALGIESRVTKVEEKNGPR